jgi:hypothetical protein
MVTETIRGRLVLPGFRAVGTVTALCDAQLVEATAVVTQWLKCAAVDNPSALWMSQPR